jgi:hypothetical protein
MITCNDDCTPVCDFCIYYRDDGGGAGEFAGEGVCEVLREKVFASGYCDRYHCFRANKPKEATHAHD